MSPKDTDISNLLVNLEKKELRYRRRSILYIVIIILAGLIWLLYTGFQVNKLRGESSDLKIKVDEMTGQVVFLENSLHEADNFKQNRINISDTELKGMFGDWESSDKVKLYMQIKELQYNETKFSLNGTSPGEGFNSPSLVSYILKQNNLLDKIVLNSGKLIELLPSVDDDLKSGDIIVYEAGYSMLYFKYKDVREGNVNKEFCIGMTPFGILELKIEFAKKLRVLRPDYSKLK